MNGRMMILLNELASVEQSYIGCSDCLFCFLAFGGYIFVCFHFIT